MNNMNNIKNPSWTPDEADDKLFSSLRLERALLTLAITLDISTRHGLNSGQFGCPWCGVGVLKFSVANNGHGAASCTTDGCVNVMQ